MDNSNSLTNSILKSNTDNNVFSSATSTSTSSSGFFSFLSNINGITWVIIILILAFLGFNVFVYLAKGTQDITNFFNPILKKLFGITLIATGGVIDLTAEGAKTVVNTTAKVVNKTAGVIDTGLTKIQELTPEAKMAEGKMADSSLPSTSSQTTGNSDMMKNNSLNNSLNTNTSQPDSYQADQAKSSVHSGGKGGWCYIGEDQGYRTCAQVSSSDMCMSGDIFPSQDICVNPNLRP